VDVFKSVPKVERPAWESDAPIDGVAPGSHLGGVFNR
jgi:hypothetical protein